MTRAMPLQKPHRSEQVVRTPPEFIWAVQERFGDIAVDLAASNDNAVVPTFCGPGSNFPDALDGLSAWHLFDGLCWLNPPYTSIGQWAFKCMMEAMLGASVALLVPASVGAKWFNEYVRPCAYVLELTPRLKFVGHKSSYPKDLILAVYTPERFIGREAWHWERKPIGPANDNGVPLIDPRQLAIPGAFEK